MNYYNLNKTGGEVKELLNAVAELQASAVKFTRQVLTPENQTNARNNIGAVSGGYVVEAVSSQINAFVSNNAFISAVSDLIAANITSGLSLATIGYVNDSSRPSFEYVSGTTGTWASNKIYVVPMDGQNKLWVQTNDGKKEISVVQNAVSTYTPDGCMVTFTPNGFSLDKTALNQTIWSYRNGYLKNSYLQGTEVTTGTEVSQDNFSLWLSGDIKSGFLKYQIAIASSSDWSLTSNVDFSLYGNSNTIYLAKDKPFFSSIQSAYFQDLNIYVSSHRNAPIFANSIASSTFKNVHIYCDSNSNLEVNWCGLFCNTVSNVTFEQCSVNKLENKSGNFSALPSTNSFFKGFFAQGGKDLHINNCLVRAISASAGAGNVFFSITAATGNFEYRNNVCFVDALRSDDYCFLRATNTNNITNYSSQNLYCISQNIANEARIATGVTLTTIRGNMPPAGSYLGQIMYDSTAKQFLIWNGDYWQQIT